MREKHPVESWLVDELSLFLFQVMFNSSHDHSLWIFFSLVLTGLSCLSLFLPLAQTFSQLMDSCPSALISFRDDKHRHLSKYSFGSISLMHRCISHVCCCSVLFCFSCSAYPRTLSIPILGSWTGQHSLIWLTVERVDDGRWTWGWL